MSLDFNGSPQSGYTSASTDFQFTGDYSETFWFNADAYGGTPYMVDYAGTSNILVYYISAGGAIGLFIGGGLAITGGSVTLGKWHMYTMTRSGTTMTLYLDAVQVNSGTQAGTLGSSTLGKRFAVNGAGSGNFFNGRMANYETYKGKVLSLAEIESKYHSRGVDNIVDNQVFNCRFNEGSTGTNPTANQPIDISKGGHTVTVHTSCTYIASTFRTIK